MTSSRRLSRFPFSALVVGACVTLLAPSPIALAQAQHCPEGRTFSGACVNPVLAQVQRRQAIINAQPRLSAQTPLNAPSEDAYYPSFANVNEPTTYILSTRNIVVTTGGSTFTVPIRLTPRFVPGPR